MPYLSIIAHIIKKVKVLNNFSVQNVVNFTTKWQENVLGKAKNADFRY